VEGAPAICPAPPDVKEKNMRTLYRFEMKKLLSRRGLWIALALGIGFLLARLH